MFFKPYSEKLFGIPADQISASWGKRKIRVGGIKDMIRRNSKLYFKNFYYPKEGGYGAICERLAGDVRPLVRLGSRLVGVVPNPVGDGYRCEFVREGETIIEEFDVLISSLPVSYFAGLLGLDVKLRFRPARLLYLLVNKPRVSDNHWFYFADRDYLINRVAEFKNFSDNGPVDTTVLCCEITRVEQFSAGRVIEELASAGIVRKEEVLDTKTISIQHAYPLYNVDFENQMKQVEMFFAGHPNIYHVGRHAQFAHKDVDEIFDEAKCAVRRIVQPQMPSARATLTRVDAAAKIQSPHTAISDLGIPSYS
jgi:protoporphyrinogen oxidase